MLKKPGLLLVVLLFNQWLVAQTSCTTTYGYMTVGICDYSLPYFWNGQVYNTGGLYSLTLTNYSGCDSIAYLNLIVSAPPPLPIAINGSRCGTGQVTIGAKLSGSTSDLLYWYSDAGLTNWVGMGTNFITPPLNVTSNYYVVEGTSTGCFGLSATTVTATINPIPTAPIVDSIVYYQQYDTALALTAVASTGDTLLWYNAASDSIGNQVAPIPSTTLVDSTIYYVSQKGVCESPREKITVIVIAKLLVPTITSFSPTSGPIDTTVTITGTNFSDTAANNIVYFGAVRAKVINANSNILTVAVPIGATYEPITVTTNGLTAYSTQFFDITFPNGGNAFTANSFASKIDYPDGAYPQNVLVKDINEDNKPDIVTSNAYGNSISLFKNQSVNGRISFAGKIDSATGGYPTEAAISDLDGDGKPDIVTVNAEASTISIYRNTSINGVISYAPRIDILYVNDEPVTITIGDLDGDGKPDLIVTGYYGTSYISIYKNTSTLGTISFAPRQDYLSVNSPVSIIISDFDGDGKPDLAIDNNASIDDYTSTFSIFRNTSTGGVISFAPGIDFITNKSPYKMVAGDFDGDGRLDLAIINPDSAKLSLYKNTTVNGIISFAPKADLPIGTGIGNICVGDLNGDGKPDLAAIGGSFAFVFMNTTMNDSITFAPFVKYVIAGNATGICIGDFDGDSKPDLVISSETTNTISILRNQIGETVKAVLCPPVGNTTLISYTTGTNYQWQLNTGSGFNNITNNSNYSNVNNDTLQLNNVPSTWYGYEYRCVVDGNNSDVYSLEFLDTWTGAVDSTWMNPLNWSCDAVPDSNTDVFINSGTVILSSNTTIRSLTVNSTASFTIVTPYNLTVTH